MEAAKCLPGRPGLDRGGSFIVTPHTSINLATIENTRADPRNMRGGLLFQPIAVIPQTSEQSSRRRT
jgi:hypothetical protein